MKISNGEDCILSVSITFLYLLHVNIINIYVCIFFKETPATATDKIFFETNDVYQKSPSEIRISWNSFNLTSNQNAGLSISLWGYEENTITLVPKNI